MAPLEQLTLAVAVAVVPDWREPVLEMGVLVGPVLSLSNTHQEQSQL